MIQAFESGEVSAEEAHEIGMQLAIKTTGLAGGLSKPYKGIVLAKPLKGPRKILPSAFLALQLVNEQSPKTIFFLSMVGN